MTAFSIRRVTLIAWAIALLGVSIAITAGKPGKLYPTFVAAGERFRHGEPLYPIIFPPEHDLFRYSPLVAAAFMPWSFIPTPVGAVLWRCLQAAVLLLALRAWSRVSVPNVPWPLLALLVLPLAAGNFHNAQLNPLVTALMLAGVVAFARERYWLAAAAIAGATLFKIYPLSLGLLLCVVEPRRFMPRLLVAIAIGIGLPFVLQSPSYVQAQCEDWLKLLELDDRSNQPMHKGYHDFQKLLLRWGLPISLTAYRIIEVLAGAIAAGFIFWGRRRGWDRAQQIQACAGLGFVWCTLFGPATESATYMLLGPVAAHAFLASIGRPRWEQVWTCGIYLVLLLANIIHWFPYSVANAFRGLLIPQAHAALLLLVWMVWRTTSWRGPISKQRSP